MVCFKYAPFLDFIGEQVPVMDTSDFMLISRNKAKKTLRARQMRLEQERKVALEAAKLTEQKGMGDPSSVPGNDSNDNEAQPVVHLSRSPIKYSMDERTGVNRMRATKKKQIERALFSENSMQLDQEQMQLAVEEDENQKADGPVAALTHKRYIPTHKEWEEQRRLKAENSQTTVDQMTPATTMTAKRYIPTTKEWDEQRRFKLKAKMETKKNATSANSTNELGAEKRKGNVTHYGANIDWTNLTRTNNNFQKMASQPMPIEGEQKDRQVKKGNVIRYTIDELLKLEPQPDDLDVPAEVALIDKKLLKGN